MNPENSLNNEFESTYALLVRSEEKSRSQLETLIYVLLVLSAVFSIWQFATQSARVPISGIVNHSHQVMAAQGS